ncbi:MAG: DNA methyltransferase [Bacilli bacterium]
MDNYELQKTSIWKFPDRGSWATHKGDYRGNWSPHIPKNLLLKYTKSEDLVLDPFVGSGTTLIECKILNRNAFGIDINPNALQISKDRLNFDVLNNSYQNLFLGNATSLSFIKDSAIDFICTHPPYADIIHYSDNLENDLSLLNYQDFIKELKKVAKELHRVLKQGHYCSFMIGDIRKHGNVIPLGFMSMQIFINEGFTLKEIIIKEQFNCSSTNYWKEKSKQLNFYLLAHEYIFVLYKNG